MQNLLNDLTELLSKDDRLVSDGRLLKNKVIELALGMDRELIKQLLTSKSITNHFFMDIDGVFVFDKIKFQKFVSNKEFLPDSYTAFKNKIGLVNEEGHYLSESKDVVLAWPYKDCVLEGGQTKEDQKRDEIFWNETLAPDEIDRLFAPKVLTNFKIYDKDGVHELKSKKEVDFSKENLVIRGNNLLALHSLYKRFACKVKLIYIDPPYNAEGDAFRYNDSFFHSSWLSFMKARLKLAKLFIKEEGVIFIQIGDEEVHYLKVLCDEIFGRDNFINTVARVSKTASNKGTYFAPSIDFILCYAKDKNLLPEFSDYVDETLYKKIETEGERKGDKYRDDVALYQSSLDTRPNQRYFIQCPDGSLVIPPGETMPQEKKEEAKAQPIQGDGVWRWAVGEGFEKNKHLIVFKKTKRSPLLDENKEKAKWNLYTKSYLIDRKKEGTKPRNYLDQFINRKGADYIKTLDIDFDYSKPVELIEYLINIVKTSEDDIIMDFFAGSATTAEAVIRVNQKDNGKRKFILCEQMDYIEEATIPRIVKILGNETFISLELMRYNAEYIGQIQKTKKTKDLHVIWKGMQEQAFISYKVDPRTINENISDFEELSLDEQKRLLIEILDKNQLYVNYSEIDDSTYNISEDDKMLNRKFYMEV
jgi:adenine-specific DNA-methyltransferase